MANAKPKPQGATKIIKHRLFTWFEETDNPMVPGGDKVLTERINHHGDEVEITNPVYVKRGEELGSFYTDTEAEQIRNGTYRGRDADILYRFRAGQKVHGQSLVEDIDDEGAQTQDMSAEELADYISGNQLTSEQTVALAGDDLESIEKVLDAENIATGNEPRADVVQALEVKMAAATQA